jgi:formate/nitrite transporter FocA (FNT family)
MIRCQGIFKKVVFRTDFMSFYSPIPPLPVIACTYSVALIIVTYNHNQLLTSQFFYTPSNGKFRNLYWC